MVEFVKKMTSKISIFLLSILFGVALQAAYETERAAVIALGDLTTAPAIYTDAATPGTSGSVSAGDLKEIYYDALDYRGNPTRVYAWIGIPAGASSASPVPGMVLVHGGGGTAYHEWVEKWVERGYAAISIAVEGQTNVDTDPVTPGNQWFKHAMAGPSRGALYDDSPDSLTDQWMYHAVADTVLANSLLRSLPQVDATKIGLSGYSWGGVITSTVIGIDDRFMFAIPTYGCGHKYDSRNYYGSNLVSNELYRQVWDPMIRIANATMPVLWFSWPEEPHFLMDSLAYTYLGAPGTRMVSLKPGMGHGGNWHSPEYYDYADSIVSGAGPWCVQQSLNTVGSIATVVFKSSKTLNAASLVYTTDNDEVTSDISTNLIWTEIAADSLVESPVGTWAVTVTLPDGVTGWFVNVEATGSDTGGLFGYVDSNIVASSDYQEINNLILSPSNTVEIEHSLAEDQSNGIVDIAYTGPANMEISSITISGESHAGAFACLTSTPLVLYTPTPDMTPISIQFDNTVAGLADAETATATLTIVWDELDGSTGQISLPISVTAHAGAIVVFDTSADWASKDVTAIDRVVVRSGAAVTVGEFVEPNRVVNGSFETPDSPDVAFNGISPITVGSDNLTGWMVADADVWLIDHWDRFGNEPNTEASDGDQYLQLQDSGSGVATIRQDIATEVGVTYQLTFDYSGVDTEAHSVELTYAVGELEQTVTYFTGTPMQAWQSELFEFQATSTTTTLSFTGDSVGGGFYGIGIDNVSVVRLSAATSGMADNIVVNDEASPTTATFNINEDFALTATTSIDLGADTGAGFVNQSTGTVTTAALTINTRGTGDLSQYTLSGGAVSATEVAVNDSGAMHLSGGTVTDGGVLRVATGGLLAIDGGSFFHPSNDTITGGGLIQMQSGTFSTGTNTNAGQILNANVEISGGTFSMLNQVIFSQNQPLEFKVIGEEASITMKYLQFGESSGSQGTLKFVFDEKGISPITVTNWMFLDLATIVVDGSAYTGGAATFPLVTSSAFLGLADPANFVVTGFEERGLHATVVQDDVVDECLTLVLVQNAYGAWAGGKGLSGADAHLTADPDGDGLNNQAEFICGSDPNDGSGHGSAPSLESGAGGLEFVYFRQVDQSSEGLSYTVKSTTDLSLPYASWGVDGLGVPVVTPIDVTLDKVAVPVVTNGESQRFVHVVVDW